MVKYENDCCGCSVPAYPCIGNSCSYRHVPYLICDDCGEEVEQGELFEFDGEELCIDCIKKRLDVVKPHDY